MANIVLLPTDTAQWQALLHEAQSYCDTHLDEELESYLVFLLIRFTTQPQVAGSVVALDFLEKMSEPPGNKLVWRDLGDKCLLFSGLFPGRAQKRRVNLSYFIDLGQSAYARLASEDREQAALFITVCEQFVNLMDVLQATRQLEPGRDNLSLIDAVELWQDHQNLEAKRVLQKHGLLTPPAGKLN